VSGVPGGEALTALAEAAVGGDEQALRAARESVRRALGDEALVDAAAVVGNFERMVRIADGTGIPLDEPMAMITADMRAELSIDAYGGAERTGEIRGAKRLAGRLLSRVLPTAFKLLARR